MKLILFFIKNIILFNNIFKLWKIYIFLNIKKGGEKYLRLFVLKLFKDFEGLFFGYG